MMRYKRLIIYILALLVSPCMLSAQVRADAKNALLLHISYGYHLPGADMAKRFKGNFSIGGSLEYKLKNDLFFGFNYAYLYGKNVTEPIAQNLLNAKGEIVGIDNHLASFVIRERGYYASLSFGKLFRPFENRSAALKVSLNGGFMQHKVRIVDDYTVVPQILNDYLPGYDRLTNGFMLQQYIGYQYLSDNRRINFSIGFVLSQGFTQSVRGFNYDTGLRDDRRRLDLLNGLQVSWILPFYFNDYSEEIIY